MASLEDSETVGGGFTDIDLCHCDDQELLGLFESTQDSRYLTEIVNRYHPLVISIVRRNVDNVYDVLDGVQATFLILIEMWKAAIADANAASGFSVSRLRWLFPARSCRGSNRLLLN